MIPAFRKQLIYVILTDRRQISTVGLVFISISGLEVNVLDSAMVDIHITSERIHDDFLLAARVST